MSSVSKIFSLLLLILSVGFSPSLADWTENGVSITGQLQSNIEEEAIVSDGSSGTILAFTACLGGVPTLIAQRFNSMGVALWGDDSAILSAAGEMWEPQITTDGAGGAIVAWLDYRSRNFDIYAQRVDGSGTVQWTVDGVAICTTVGSHRRPKITSDGAGGAIVAWLDDRNGNDDIYAQHVDGSGTVQWTVDGIPLCTAVDDQWWPRITTDGAGGAIVAWIDERSGNKEIYAQRVDGSGALQWTVDGVAICTTGGNPSYPEASSDGVGGAIVTWSDYRNGNNDIYAQRVDADGGIHAGWAVDGVAICTLAGTQTDQIITSDGAGGAIVTWEDYRNGNADIYGQRVDGSGVMQWTVDGIALCTAAGYQEDPQITNDGAGGAIVTWIDERSGNDDIYAQRVDADGGIHAGWTVDGVALCTAGGIRQYPQITTDGAGGAIVTWLDRRSSTEGIYGQRVDGSGAVQWTVDGVALCTTTLGSQKNPQITTDGAGGAIITWKDNRSGNEDIYAQRVDGSGAAQWTMDGVAICTATGDQEDPQITTDGAGGAIVTWSDYRSGNGDIYAQRVDGSGAVQWTVDGVTLCTAAGAQWEPQITNDGAGGAIVTWSDYRSGNDEIYAQRVDGSGAVQWTADGVALCTVAGDKWEPQITPDGAGGAIVTWIDDRSVDEDIYAQRVDSDGGIHAGWTVDGVALCTATGAQENLQIISDGAGGAIVNWDDSRSGNYDTYAQRVDGSGTVQWTVDGAALCTAMADQRYSQITTDAGGGAIVTWMDERNGNKDIYAQRVDGSGAVQWMVDGVALCTAAGNQNYPQITFFGAGGAIVTWSGFESGIYYIDAQSVDAFGAVQWTVDGIALCEEGGYRSNLQITNDGDGGAIVAWQDYRCSDLIFAHRLSSGGVITSTTLHQYSAVLSGTDVHICWTLSEIDDDASFSIFRASVPGWIYREINDARILRDGLSFTFTDSDCVPGSTYQYMIKCEVEGQLSRVLFETDAMAIPALPLTLYPSYPNPFNPQTVIRFYLPVAQEISLDIYNVTGQRVARLVEGKKPGGYHEMTWDGRNSAGGAVASGVYFAKLRSGKHAKVVKLVLMR